MSAFIKLLQIKNKLAQLHTRDHQASEMIERGQRLKAEVAIKIEAAEAELASAVSASVEGNVDPTGWLPNELMILILLHLVYSFDDCRSVCKRWHRLCRDRQMKVVMDLSRWRGYVNGTVSPRTMTGHTNWVYALAVGKQGKVYSGSEDRTVKVWCGSSGDLLQTLTGHTDYVRALAIGHDGRVYSGSHDCTVKVWSGDDGLLTNTLTGHSSSVCSLAANLLHHCVQAGLVAGTRGRKVTETFGGGRTYGEKENRNLLAYMGNKSEFHFAIWSGLMSHTVTLMFDIAYN